MLPAIITHARIAFRHLKGEARQDAVQETIANALVAFMRLVRRGKIDLAYPTVLARYAIAQFQDGRRVGNRLNIKDVLSPYAQKQKGIVVERLDKFDKEEDQWLEAVVEDHRTPVPDQVAFRCDFPAWLARLSRRNRRIAQALFDVSPGKSGVDVRALMDHSATTENLEVTLRTCRSPRGVGGGKEHSCSRDGSAKPYCTAAKFLPLLRQDI